MSCFVCLQAKNLNQIFNIFDKNNIHYNESFIISKYLSFKPLQPTEDNISSKKICFDCWNHLKNFHEFYTIIEEAHMTISIIADKIDTVNDVKKEEIDSLIIESFCDINLYVEPFKFEDQQIAKNDVSKFIDTTCINIDIKEDTSNSSKVVKKSLNKTKTNFIQNSDIKEDTSNSSKVVKKSLNKTKTNFIQNSDIKEDTSNSSKVVKKSLNKTKSNFILNSEESDEKVSNFMILNCDICSEKIPTFAVLKRHYRKVHNKNGYAICCKRKYFKRCMLIEHINSHVNPEHFKCDQCNKIMSSKDALRKHMKTHISKNEDRVLLNCNLCEKKFSDKVGLSRHQPIHIPQDQWTWKCSECEKLLPSKFFLQTHISDNHSNKRMCQICGKLVQTKRFKEHMSKHADIEETRVQCETCGAWMKNKKHLQIHTAKHLDVNITHKCTICGKLSPNKKALNIHINYTHSEQKNHECSICHKSFKRPLVLKQHMAGHTGNPLYSCSYCPRTFIYDSHYHSHRKKAHREQWEADKAANMKSRTNFLKIKNDIENKNIDDICLTGN